jgi:hypothetical protein
MLPAFLPVLQVGALLDQSDQLLLPGPAFILALHSVISPLGYGYI